MDDSDDIQNYLPPGISLTGDFLGHESRSVMVCRRDADGLLMVLKSVGAHEMQALMDLSYEPTCSEHVSCLYYIIETPHNRKMVLQEYVGRYSLYKTVLARKDGMHWNAAQQWDMMRQLIDGLVYIHSKGYAHRDIKPENIVVSADGIYKYIDFGFACNASFKCDNNNNSGTLLYFAPESWTKINDNSDPPEILLQYAQARDVWALGMVFYELLYGAQPFDLDYIDDDDEDYQFWERIRNAILDEPLLSDDDYPEVSDVIANMLNMNREERPTAAEVSRLISSYGY